MITRFTQRLFFRIERWMQRGALNQMLAMAAIIASVAIVAGCVVFVAGEFNTLNEAIWWGFLRLTDPGYLGDDTGLFLRIVSTGVTVLGYVLFMGSLIAIMTQWLRERMQKLESGLTPIAVRGHILVLGWSTRTTAIVRELLLSEGRVQRFLKRRNARRLRIVVLTENLDSRLATELREQLGPHWSERKIILRSGTPLRTEHLRRVNARGASAIIMPGSDFGAGGPEGTDARVVKTLMSLSDEVAQDQDDYPAVVAEVFNANNARIASRTYRGDVEVIASDAFLSRLIAQNVRHPGLSYVYSELLSYGTGNEVYLRSCPEMAGRRFGDVRCSFQRSVLLGVARPDGSGVTPHLNPSPDFQTRADDRYVLIADTYESAAPESGGAHSGVTVPLPAGARSSSSRSRILILGWSRKVPALLQQFDGYASEHFEIDVASVVPAARRQRLVERQSTEFRRVSIRQIEADYTVAADLAALEPETYDSIVFLGSDWLQSGEESDARTVLGYALYRSIAADRAGHPHVVVELMDPDNARLFEHQEGEVIISPVVLSHLLAHVALRRELHAVFEELFGTGGAEIVFNSAADYGLGPAPVRFSEVEAQAQERGEIALGLRIAGAGADSGGVRLNPDRNQVWRPADADEVVVLTTYARETEISGVAATSEMSR